MEDNIWLTTTNDIITPTGTTRYHSVATIVNALWTVGGLGQLDGVFKYTLASGWEAKDPLPADFQQGALTKFNVVE